ncbi:MAG: 50S ribosomal protein L9 [Candidatus Omnitrophota bacterium]|nr:50S ribosomal protein L9 [Candidatus Omnitrophota bacterium]
MQEVILRKDVKELGKSGEVVKVNDGFARNFLIPRRLAVIATQENLKRIEHEKRLKAQLAEKEKKTAQELAEKLKGISCTVAVEVNEKDKLYGAVTEIDIAKALEVEGFKIDKSNVILEGPIEDLGIFDVEVRLHPEVTTKIRLWVTKR